MVWFFFFFLSFSRRNFFSYRDLGTFYYYRFRLTLLVYTQFFSTAPLPVLVFATFLVTLSVSERRTETNVKDHESLHARKCISNTSTTPKKPKQKLNREETPASTTTTTTTPTTTPYVPPVQQSGLVKPETLSIHVRKKETTECLMG